MKITDYQILKTDGECELSASIRPELKNKRSFRVWFRFPACFPPPKTWGDPFLAGFLIPCMFSREALHVAGPVSADLLGSITRIQQQICDWYPDFSRIQLTCDPVDPCSFPENPETGLFFSSGVDSVFSAVKNLQDTTRLIYVQGFENPVSDRMRLETTSRQLKRLSLGLGKKVITVSTNLRSRGDLQFSNWGRRYRGSFFGFCYMGSMLAAVGLCLQESFRQITIPASQTWDHLIPYGSHPDLDPLWSNGRVRFFHHGCDASRLEKIRSLSNQASWSLDELQVCENHKPEEINCGSCDKCLRTMLALRLCGYCGFGAFSEKLNLNRLEERADLKRYRHEYEAFFQAAALERDLVMQRCLNVLLNKKNSWVRLIAEFLQNLKEVLWKMVPGLMMMLKGNRRKRW